MIYPTIEQIINDHVIIIQFTGGTPGIKDRKLLESAYYNSLQTFAGQELYQKIEEKFAVLCYGLSQNHPFQDGNKRIAVHVLIVGLAVNGIELSYTQQELINLGLDIAQGKFNKEDILKWIEEHKKL
jgi:death-on-curing protein